MNLNFSIWIRMESFENKEKDDSIGIKLKESIKFLKKV